MRKVIVLLVLSKLISCSHLLTEVNFEVINNSGSNIECLAIQPDQDQRKLEIEKGGSVNFWLNTDGFPRRDGEYVLSYKLKDKEIIKNFGYYSNGYPMEKKIIIEIKKDTVIFDFKN